MAITVGDIYKQFPTFRPEDMVKLMNGRTDFNGRDTVSLQNIATFKGQYDKELSVFVAKKEGKSFVGMLNGSKLENVQKETGIQANKKDSSQKKQGAGHIAMNTSIFDVAKQNLQSNKPEMV